MNTPKRIQRKRSKGWRLPPNTVCVTRPGRFGNPFNWQDAPRDLYTEEQAKSTAVMFFREWLNGKRDAPNGEAASAIMDHIDDLRGKNLACFCPEGSPCHADVLLERSNA